MSFLDKLFGKKETKVENNIESKVETKTNKVEPMPRDQFFDLIMNVCEWVSYETGSNKAAWS